MVELLVANEKVVGSNPIHRSNFTAVGVAGETQIDKTRTPFESEQQYFYMRSSYSGNTLAFQAKARSSILLLRSKTHLNTR